LNVEYISSVFGRTWRHVHTTRN